MSMFSFLSRKNMPPGSPGPSTGSSSSDGGAPSLDDIVADLKKEWDRRLEALSMCLDEKSQENTQLHKLLKEREEGEKQLRNKIASLEVDLQAEKDVVREHQRRLEAMTRVLEDSIMHQSASVGQLPQFSDIENEKFLTPDEVAARKASTSSETASAMDSLPGNNYLASMSQRGGKGGPTSSPTKKSNADPEPDSSESDKKAKNTTEDKKSTESKEAKPIKRAEKVGAKKDSASGNSSASKDDESEKEQEDPLKITPAEERDPLKALSDAKVTIFKLKKENTVYQQKNEALAESICKYESKLVKADKYFRENLLKESRRRKDAEYVAAVLKKRVTQLQFLLDEANNSQSDSDKTPRSGEVSSPSKESQDEGEKEEEEETEKKKPVKRATAKKRSKKSKGDSDSNSDDE